MYYEKLSVELANEVDKIIGGRKLLSAAELRQREQIARLLLNGEPRRG